MGIKFILTTCLLVLAIIYFRSIRTKLFDRLIVVGILVIGCVMVVYPMLTVEIANFLGVGRGTDLILYFAVLSFSYISVMLFIKIRDLEWRLTKLARNESLEQAVRSKNNKED